MKLLGSREPFAASRLARGLLSETGVVPHRIGLVALVLALAGCAPAGTGGDGLGSGGGGGGKADRGGDEGPPASRIELKVTIAEADIDRALEALELDFDEAERRYVTFYDTNELALFEAGIVLRSRKIIDDDDDSTVKIRPLDAEAAWDLVPELFAEEGGKCEIDRTPTREVSSCSLTVLQDRGEIDEVADGEREVSKLFSSEQEAMLDLFAPAGFELDEALVLGPIDTVRWKIEPADLPHELTVELWLMPDGSELLEVSLKTGEDDADDALEALLAFLEALDVALDESQSTKTRRALEHFAR